MNENSTLGVVTVPPVHKLDVVPVHQHEGCISALGVVLKVWEAYGISYPREVQCSICSAMVIANLEEYHG